MFFKSSGSSMFKDITIPAMFIDMYVPIADGNQLKVYLFGYKSAFFFNGRENQTLDDKQIANAIGISEKEVEEAWKFWESMGIVKIHDNDGNKEIEFLDIYAETIQKLYGEDVDSDKEEENNEENSSNPSDPNLDFIVESSSKPDGKNMLEKIEEITGRVLTPSERISLLSTLEEYNMENELAVYAFEKAHKDGSGKSMSYILGILKSWNQKGFTTLRDAQMESEESRNRNSIYDTIMKSLGLYRSPTVYERRIMDDWIEKYHMSMEMIDEACSKSLNIQNPNIKYIDGVIKKWAEKGISTKEQIGEFEKLQKKDKEGSQNINYGRPQVKTKFHNFEQQVTGKYKDEEIIKRIRDLNKD